MRSYFARHKALDVDVSTFWKLFDKKVQDAISSADESKGGALVARAERELKAENGSNRGFLDVVFARRSVREFLAVPVSDDDISRAINIAQQSPSVCNRQPVRVHMFTDPSTIAKALELQGGFRGYKASPRLLLVTADNTAFVAAVERNQAYIDGGLFAMMLLLGLENVGLGGCPLNTMLNSERESALRKLLGIPSHEVFITFIAVGHFDPDVLTPRSTRLPQSEILTTHE
jgi:nitroreductase